MVSLDVAGSGIGGVPILQNNQAGYFHTRN